MRRKGPRLVSKRRMREILRVTKHFICSFTKSRIETIKQVITRQCGKYSDGEVEGTKPAMIMGSIIPMRTLFRVKGTK